MAIETTSCVADYEAMALMEEMRRTNLGKLPDAALGERAKFDVADAAQKVLNPTGESPEQKK